MSMPMRLAAFATFLMIMLTAACGGSKGTGGTGSGSPTGTVVGRCTNSGGTALNGVNVTIQNDIAPASFTILAASSSLPDGSFSITGVPVGSWFIVCKTTDGTLKKTGGVTVTAGATTNAGTIIMSQPNG